MLDTLAMPAPAKGTTLLAALLIVTGTASLAEAREAFVLTAGALALVEPTGEDRGDPLFGPTFSLALLDEHSTTWRLEPGVEIQGSVALGQRDRWVADGWLAFVATLALTDGLANPFIAFGPTVGAFGREEVDEEWTLGVRGDAGLHGTIGGGLYWRAAIGLVGPAVNAIRTELSIGYAAR